jgi:hypothetical protein
LHWEITMLCPKYRMNISRVNIIYDILNKKKFDIFCFNDEYCDCNIIISQCNSKSFFNKIISERSSAKSNTKENFWILCNVLIHSHGANNAKSNFENLCIRSYQYILLLVEAREAETFKDKRLWWDIYDKKFSTLSQVEV